MQEGGFSFKSKTNDGCLAKIKVKIYLQDGKDAVRVDKMTLIENDTVTPKFVRVLKKFKNKKLVIETLSLKSDTLFFIATNVHKLMTDEN